MSFIRVNEVGDDSLERVNKLLHNVPGGVYKAAFSALKRAGDTAKTRAGQFAAAEYTINKGDFMRNVHSKSHITGGAGGVMGMSISFSGTVLPLLTFNTTYSRDGTVQTQVKRNGGAATLQHAFVAKIFGPTAVFERVGAPRFPVEQKFGPSTGHMMRNEEVIAKMDETIRDTYENYSAGTPAGLHQGGHRRPDHADQNAEGRHGAGLPPGRRLPDAPA